MQAILIKRWRLMIHSVFVLMSWQVGEAQQLVVVDWDEIWVGSSIHQYVEQRQQQLSDTLMVVGKQEVAYFQRRYNEIHRIASHMPRESVGYQQLEQEILDCQDYILRLEAMLENQVMNLDSTVKENSLPIIAEYIKTQHPEWTVLDREYFLYVADDLDKTDIIIEQLSARSHHTLQDLEQSEQILQEVLQQNGMGEFIRLN